MFDSSSWEHEWFISWLLQLQWENLHFQKQYQFPICLNNIQDDPVKWNVDQSPAIRPRMLATSVSLSMSCTVDVSRCWFPTFLLEPSHTHLSEPKINSWAETLALCSDAASLSVCGPGPSVIQGDKTRWHHWRVIGRWHAFMNPLRRPWSDQTKTETFCRVLKDGDCIC